MLPMLRDVRRYNLLTVPNKIPIDPPERTAAHKVMGIMCIDDKKLRIFGKNSTAIASPDITAKMQFFGEIDRIRGTANAAPSASPNKYAAVIAPTISKMEPNVS